MWPAAGFPVRQHRLTWLISMNSWKLHNSVPISEMGKLRPRKFKQELATNSNPDWFRSVPAVTCTLRTLHSSVTSGVITGLHSSPSDIAYKRGALPTSLNHSETQIHHLKKGQWHGSQEGEEWMNDPKAPRTPHTGSPGYTPGIVATVIFPLTEFI